MKKNLVYLSCFLNKHYLRFLELLFGSVAVYSADSLKNIDFLVMTQNDFAEDIRSIGKKFNINIILVILEKPYNIFIATTFRYEIFNWEHIYNYEKSLYIDTDILIHGELNTIFEMATDSTKLYTFREGPISHEYWGGSEIFDFQGEDSEIDPTLQGFCTGILLFFNNTIVSDIFKKGKSFMLKKIQVPGSKIPICYDQPYFNYICAKDHTNENISLEKKCINRASELYDEYILYHFPDVSFGVKYSNMLKMILQMLKTTESSTLKDEILYFIQDGQKFLREYDELKDEHKKF